MTLKTKVLGLFAAACLMGVSQPSTSANASSFFFTTNTPDGLMAAASRPDFGGASEIETGDDFVLTKPTSITSATFTGLLPANASITNVVVEIYRVFPNNSDVGRTSGPPTFSTANVPTRVNSPSDVAFDSRVAPSDLTFQTREINPNFTAANSVQPNGIHPKPGQTTGGNGQVTGNEVQFNVNFTKAFNLPADHYFFVPQVALDSGAFLWLSSQRPIVAPGTPFPQGFTDLQAWTRDGSIDPDWLRIGTDIVGPPVTGGSAPTFNMTFSLTGTEVPIPAALPLFATGLGALGLLGWRRKRKAALAA
jgi:hypothetical protein